MVALYQSRWTHNKRTYSTSHLYSTWRTSEAKQNVPISFESVFLLELLLSSFLLCRVSFLRIVFEDKTNVIFNIFNMKNQFKYFSFHFVLNFRF